MLIVRNLSWMVVIIAVVFLVTAITGCSGEDSFAVAPDNDLNADMVITRHLWGLYEVIVDVNAGTIEAMPLRQAGLRLNVLPFLEPPLLENLRVDFSDLDIVPPSGGEDGRIVVDVLMTHPFSGQTQFTGFDVKGIVFGPRVWNADGSTRWWNPTEFTGGGIFGYEPGMLGSPDSSVFTEVVNGYKYFAFDLGENEDLEIQVVIDKIISQRGHFPAGETLSRHYELNFGPEPEDFFVFQYAVDASWLPPSGNPPYEPENFPPHANQPEAWNITYTEIENALNYYGGVGTGDLILHVATYDWQGCDDTEVTLSCEEPDVFDPVTATTPIVDYGDYAIYEFSVVDAEPGYSGNLPLTIAALSTDKVYGYGNPGGSPYPEGYVTAYKRIIVEVADEPTVEIDCETTLHAKEGWTTGLSIDSSDLRPIWDMAFTETGPYDGYAIYPWRSGNSGPVTELRYLDTDDPIDTPTNGTFHTLSNLDQNDMIWSIDCDPVMGRVVWVGDDKPHTFRILDDNGNKLGEMQVQAVSSVIAVQAACFDGDGNLWVLSLRTTMFEPDFELRRYKPIAGSPYYSEDQYLDLSPYDPFSLLSFIYDMDYCNQANRLYIFDMHGLFSDLGSVDVFDIAPDGTPTRNLTVSKEDIFPSEVDLLPPGIDGRHHWYHHVAWGGDMVIDHSAGDFEYCRIACMAVLEDDDSEGDTDNYWVLFDKDLNILDDYHEPFDETQGSKCWDTFAVNPDSNRNVVAMWRSSTWEYAAKPVDW